MQVVPYLMFNGQCEAAFKRYADVLNGKLVTLMPHAGSPGSEQLPPEWQSKILHAHLDLAQGALMGSDAWPGQYQTPVGCSVSLQFTDPSEAERVFQALAVNGNVQMPLQQTFWAQSFGMLVDEFGIPWLINCA